MKKRLSYGLLIVAASIAILVIALSSGFKSVIIKYAGHKVVGTVADLPSGCDKYNSIKVLVNNKQYEISISKAACREGRYKVGQQVELLKHDKYEELVWPGSYPELVMFLIIGILIYSYFTVRKYYHKK